MIGDAAARGQRPRPPTRARSSRATASSRCRASSRTRGASFPTRSRAGRRARGDRGRAAAPALAVAQVLVPSARAGAGRAWPTPSTAIRRAALTLVGITGTNGKTTTSYLVDALLRARGLAHRRHRHHPVRAGRRDARRPSQTTPEALEICSDAGARCATAASAGVAMEVSSHALALSRVDGLAFDVAVFTNLTQDHLDFHGTLDEYRRGQAAPVRAARRLAEAARGPPSSTPTIRPGRAMVRGPRPARCCRSASAPARACAPSSTPRRSTASA